MTTPTTPDTRPWCWATDDETWNGPCSTRDDAMDALHEAYEEKRESGDYDADTPGPFGGETPYLAIGRCRMLLLENYTAAEEILERANERACDDLSLDDDVWEIPPERAEIAEKALRDFIAAWASVYVETSGTFAVENAEELTPADLTAWSVRMDAEKAKGREEATPTK